MVLPVIKNRFISPGSKDVLTRCFYKELSGIEVGVTELTQFESVTLDRALSFKRFLKRFGTSSERPPH